MKRKMVKAFGDLWRFCLALATSHWKAG